MTNLGCRHVAAAIALAALVLPAGALRAQPTEICGFQADVKVRVGNGSGVGGNLGANSEGGRVLLGRHVTAADDTALEATNVRVGNGSSVFDVSAVNLLRGKGSVVRGDISTTVDLPLSDPFCEIPAIDCGGENVALAKGDAPRTLSPGAYGAITLQNGTTLRLEAGEYDICALKAGRNVTILVTGATQSTINVAGNFELGNGSHLRSADGTPTAVLNVAGARVRFGAGSEAQACLSAPDAHVSVGRGADFTGAVCSQTLGTGRRVQLICADDCVAPPPTTTTTTTTPSTSSTSTTTTTTTTLQEPFCGDGVINQASEECDTNDFGGATCDSSPLPVFLPLGGSPTGSLLCTVECTIDRSNCDGTTTTTTVETTTTTIESTTTTSTTVEPTTTTIEPTTTTIEATTTTIEATTTTSTSSTTTTTEGPGTTTTSMAPSTTLPTTTTTTTSSSTTSTSSSTTTTTSSTTTTSMPAANPTAVDLTVTLGGGQCGEARDGQNLTGNVTDILSCGGLNLGGGSGNTVAEGLTPSGSTNRFAITGCVGNNCTLGGAALGTATTTRDCSTTDCFFGTPLPIPNGGQTTCVINTFAAPASGTLDVSTGVITNLAISLNSNIRVTGISNVGQPCPICTVVGTPSPTNPLVGTCDRGANSGGACTTTNPQKLSKHCPPGGADGSISAGTIAVNLTPLTTGTKTESNATGAFCPGQTTVGCFGSGLCRSFQENGAPAGSLLPVGTTRAIKLASTFCIPATSSALVNFAAKLPGPGALSIVGDMTLVQ